MSEQIWIQLGRLLGLQNEVSHSFTYNYSPAALMYM